MGEYRILLEGAEAEIVEKKSRFIATIEPVNSEAEAVSFIERMKKKYWDAKHNCSAFVIGEKAELTRCSDDGEPSGTAGRPMLEVLLGSEVRNIAVVVTRYFGGVLLGTGGLVRAYQSAVKEALELCQPGDVVYGIRERIDTDYPGAGKIQYLLGEQKIKVLSSEYGEKVAFEVFLPIEQAEKILAAITETTAGKALFTELGRE